MHVHVHAMLYTLLLGYLTKIAKALKRVIL